MTDEYATLRAAFHAGATIQAYTVEGRSGYWPLDDVHDMGYWRDIDGEPKFSCHFSRYRIRPDSESQA